MTSPSETTMNQMAAEHEMGMLEHIPGSGRAAAGRKP
jgi:hypothetical protein